MRHKDWGQLVPRAARWGRRGGERRDLDSKKHPPLPSSRPRPGGGANKGSRHVENPHQQMGP